MQCLVIAVLALGASAALAAPTADAQALPADRVAIKPAAKATPATAPAAHAPVEPTKRATRRDESIDPELVRKLAIEMASESIADDVYDAEVWFRWADMRLRRFVASEKERITILTAVHREAQRQHIDADLVLAVIEVESRFDRYAVSRAGAQGVMQIMPFWRHEIGRDNDNLIDIVTNIRYGTSILAYYINVARGDVVQALARYNGSHGLLNYPERVIGAWRKRWQQKLDAELPEMTKGCAKYDLNACQR